MMICLCPQNVFLLYIFLLTMRNEFEFRVKILKTTTKIARPMATIQNVVGNFSKQAVTRDFMLFSEERKARFVVVLQDVSSCFGDDDDDSF